MINDSVHCPNCGHCGYIVAIGTGDLEDFVATVCHCCGHVLDRNGLAECLAGSKRSAAAVSPDKTTVQTSFRAPRRPR